MRWANGMLSGGILVGLEVGGGGGLARHPLQPLLQQLHLVLHCSRVEAVKEGQEGRRRGGRRVRGMARDSMRPVGSLSRHLRTSFSILATFAGFIVQRHDYNTIRNAFG